MAGYSNPYGDRGNLDRISRASASERQRGQRASNNAHWMRLLSDSAPTVGSLAGMGIGAALGAGAGGIGAVPGASIGGMLGGGVGSLLGGWGNAAADEQTRPHEEADLRRRRQLDMANRLLGGV